MHALVREVLLNGLGQTRQARLHLRVAEALEDRLSGRGDQSAELAYHLLAAGHAAEAGKVARYAEDAGISALERLGYLQAADFFRSASRRSSEIETPTQRCAGGSTSGLVRRWPGRDG